MASGPQQRSASIVNVKQGAQDSKTGGDASKGDFSSCLNQFKATILQQQEFKYAYHSVGAHPIKEFCDVVTSHALPRESRDDFIPLMELANAIRRLGFEAHDFSSDSTVFVTVFIEYVREFNRLRKLVRSSQSLSVGDDVGLELSVDGATVEKKKAPAEMGGGTAAVLTIAALNAEVKFFKESVVDKLQDVTKVHDARYYTFKLYNEEKNHRHGVQRRIQKLGSDDPKRKQLENYLNEPSLFDVLSVAEINDDLAALGLLSHLRALNQAAFFDIDFNGEEKKQSDLSGGVSSVDTLDLVIKQLSFNGGLKQGLAVIKNQTFLKAFSNIILRLIDKDCCHLLPKEAALIRGAKINERDAFFREDIQHKEEAYQYFVRQQKIYALLAALRELDEITKTRGQEAKTVDPSVPSSLFTFLVPAGRAVYNDGLVEAKRILETPGADPDVVLEAVLDTIAAVRFPSQSAFKKTFAHSAKVNSQSDMGWGFKWAFGVLVIALLIFAGIQLGIDPNAVIQGYKAVNVYTIADSGVAGVAVVGGWIRAYNKKCGLAKSLGFFAPYTALYQQAPALAVSEESAAGDRSESGRSVTSKARRSNAPGKRVAPSEG